MALKKRAGGSSAKRRSLRARITDAAHRKRHEEATGPSGRVDPQSAQNTQQSRPA